MFVRRVPAIVLSLGLGAAALAVVPVAVASDGGNATDVVARKACERSSDVRLRVDFAEGDTQRLVAIGAVFSEDDDFWSWKLKHDDTLSAQGEVKARDDIDRSFRVSRTMLNFEGEDNVTFRAENERTGEVCKVDVDF